MLSLASKKLKKEAYKDNPDCFWASDTMESKTDFGIIYYENNSSKVLEEEVEFVTLQGYELMFPYKGTKANIKVEPGEKQIILLWRTVM